jgi:hypothetical protein
MPGCDWEKPSFSVAVMERTKVICCKCNKETAGTHKYNGDILCKECFLLIPGKGISLETSFYTDNDKRYEFVTEMFDGKPVQIRSKRQFKRLLKEHNMADASIKECMQQADFRKKLNAEKEIRKRRKTAEEMFSKNRELLRFRR